MSTLSPKPYVSLHFLSLFQVQKVSKNRDTELELKVGLPQETTCGGVVGWVDCKWKFLGT